MDDLGQCNVISALIISVNNILLDFVGRRWTAKNSHGVQGVASSNPAAPTSNTKGFYRKVETLFVGSPLLRIDQGTIPGPIVLAQGKTDSTRRDKPACAKCAHYFITHDARFPYGCRAMGFKSRRSPQEEISAVTGAPCLAYEARAGARSDLK